MFTCQSRGEIETLRNLSKATDAELRALEMTLGDWDNSSAAADVCVLRLRDVLRCLTMVTRVRVCKRCFTVKSGKLLLRGTVSCTKMWAG